MPSRRKILAGAAIASVAAAAAAPLLWRRNRRVSKSLRPDPAGILDLRPGFRYAILERAGDLMDDGVRVPESPDGMGCMVHPSDPSKLVLLRNHELHAPRGGVTRLVVDRKTFARVSSNRLLTGTDLNCSGGLFPGVGWISCEESDAAGHGYAYLVDATGEQTAPPRRIPSYGRFRHEAVAIEPPTFHAYLTEDNPEGCLYRFRPANLHSPFKGQLEALAVKGKPALDTTAARTGDTFEVEWVPISTPDAPGLGVTREARAAGAAVICRGEGIVWHGDRAYFCATAGGPARRGQIFELRPAAGELRVLAASTTREKLDMPDNITVGPGGDIYVAEDDAVGANYIRALSPSGAVHDIAFNYASPRELAGVCFSPDFRALFFNMYAEGFTVVVTREDGQAWEPLA